MIWVIPMAGNGTRTRKLGEFKPFIEINGHRMFGWFLSSVKHLIDPCDKFILITTDYFAKKYNFEAEVKKIFTYHNIPNKLQIITCKDTPVGASATVFLAKNEINTEKSVMVINPDQYVDFKLPTIKQNSGYLGIYFQPGDKSGFVEIENGLITKFVEKKNISNLGDFGIYAVSSGKNLIWALREQFREGKKLNGEFYIGEAFNYLIKKGVKVLPIPVIAKYDLGNPEDIGYFSERPFKY